MSTPTDQAMRWALVKFVTDLKTQEMEDRLRPCKENGWAMSSSHEIYDDVIAVLTGLATGALNAEAYLEIERRDALGEIR